MVSLEHNSTNFRLKVGLYEDIQVIATKTKNSEIHDLIEGLKNDALREKYYIKGLYDNAYSYYTTTTTP
jgi:hypothetical protein